jgi:hypothetical protein
MIWLAIEAVRVKIRSEAGTHHYENATYEAIRTKRADCRSYQYHERKNLMINHMKRLAGALLIFSTLGAVTAYGCDQYSSCSAPDCTPYTACSGHD